MRRGGYVYILTNRPDGTLYLGVARDLRQRLWQHRHDKKGFVGRYGLYRLVYVESHPTIMAAITREKQLKQWQRAWKVRLILGTNPEWDDLTPELVDLD